MKKSIIALCLSALICCGCGSTYQTTSVLTGASIGGNVGGAIGGLAGSSRHWDGGYRGSAIGTLVGTLAGAAIGGAISSAQEKKAQEYQVEERSNYVPNPQIAPSSIGNLRIRNIRFVDDDRNHAIRSEENCKVIFEIMNESHETVYNVVPIVSTDSKRIHVSPSVMIEQIAPRSGIKYTANLKAGKRLKEDQITIHVGVADYQGTEYDWQEFVLPAYR